MFMQEIRHFYYSLLKGIKYFMFLVLGCYFISQGDVLTKFNLGRTSFAEYREPMTEHPTIMIKQIFNKYGQNTTYGRDFNISIKTSGSSLEKNLTLGENVLDGSLEVSMEEINGAKESKIRGRYRIIPKNPFKRFTHSQFELIWTYSDSYHEVSHLGMILSTENNSIPCINSDFSDCDENIYNDGSFQDIMLRPSDAAWVFVSPEKYVYLKEIEKCRERPFNEDLLKTVVRRMSSNCSKPCKPDIKFGANLDKITDQLSICKNNQEINCYDAMVNHAKRTANRKPCTKISFHTRTSVYHGWTNPNQVRFVIIFSPPEMTVKEEYLIYDMVSMISAIGGTMGLCVGFSFNDISSFVLDQMNAAINWAKSAKTNHENVKVIARVEPITNESGFRN